MNSNHNKIVGFVLGLALYSIPATAQESEYQPFEQSRPANSFQEQTPVDDFEQHSIYEVNEKKEENRDNSGGYSPNTGSPGARNKIGSRDGNSPPPPEDTPIDGGLTVLLAAGAAYGVKKYREHKKNGAEDEGEK